MSASEKSSFGLTPPGPIAYLTPEFPGQTHTWIWREIAHMREWGVDIRLFSTRPPGSESAARHAFAEQARKETMYLWPRSFGSIVAAVAWAALKRRRRFLQAAAIVLTLDGMSLRERVSTIPLIAAACVLAREITAQGIRHLHLHSAARSAVIAMMTHRLVGTPYSITLNAGVEGWGGGMASKLSESEFTAVNAEWLLNEVRNGHPHLRASQVLLARPGVDSRVWAPGKQETAANFHLVTVARLNHVKGHDVTMRALARLRRSGRDVQLSIVGDGPDRAALQELGERLGLDGFVHFTGSQSEEDVIRQLRSADAFVLASRSEPLGVAYMEAMALGLPTIGTDAGGVGEIITPERDGLLVPPEDDERLEAAVARLMDDPELRRRLGRNARRTIVKRFDSRLGAATLYERLFGDPPPRAKLSDR